MNKLLPILLVVVISGCSTINKSIGVIEEDTTYLPNGEKVQRITCHHIHGGDCENEVALNCKSKGYTIFSKNVPRHQGTVITYKCGNE